MSALVLLRADGLAVDPGGDTWTEVTVRNTGSTVEQFTIEVVGVAAEWATVEPPLLSLFPAAEGTATIHFAPPRSPDVQPGPTTFGVKVTPSDDPSDSVVEEGELVVGSFADVAAELLPLVSKGRRKVKHRIAVDNRGNDRALARVTVTDPEQHLKAVVRPDPLFVEPGTAGFSVLRLQARKRFLKGPAKLHPFKVLVDVPGSEPIELNGQMNQPAVLPRGSMLVAAALAAALLWFMLVKPAVRSTANDAVAADLAAAEKENAALKKDVAEAQKKLDELVTTTTTTAPAEETTTTTTSSTTTTTTAPAAAPTSSSFDRRLAVVAEPGNTATASFTVPRGQTLSLTDLVVQNVNGSAGEMKVQRMASATATPTDLLVARLETFRDSPYQFSTPLVFAENQVVRLFVSCKPAQPACSVGLLVTGKMETTPPPTTTTTSTTTTTRP
ncbi:MAG TPA: hypothetical protein VHF47_14295 [Acidimicrobiales bacterium]|nr:hypothetical protein [Acidimicrobiales bacterium]